MTGNPVLTESTLCRIAQWPADMLKRGNLSDEINLYLIDLRPSRLREIDLHMEGV